MANKVRRQVALDTETTGMFADKGDRLISIGCVEIEERRLTKKTFYRLINPEREVDEEAARVHGYTWEKLKGQPLFEDIVDEFLAFIKGAELLIHNAEFDVGFLDMELTRLGKGKLKDYCSGIVDTLALARNLRPGQRNNLDVLCSVYGVDNTDRTLHGALIDAQLLAKVYLAMTRGQESLDISTVDISALPPMPEDTSVLRIVKASAEELQAHAATMALIDKESKGQTVWTEAKG
ncbi:MAG TPA: DNA polymerase III subunit epsilon [Candidatus Aphodousia gallistercoris]|mgnify:CR=1 FL=1|nr:DNA polymerase III subunit epsilon [Candidatus Aphodousia gallistercoris]